MFVILCVIGFLNAAPGADKIDRQPSSGLAVGAVVALAIWFAGPTSGASMNPARSLALACSRSSRCSTCGSTSSARSAAPCSPASPAA